jgi:hypothetical protein
MDQAGEYQKLAIKRYPARAIRETAEGKYWGRFATPKVSKQVSLLPPPQESHSPTPNPFAFSIATSPSACRCQCCSQTVSPPAQLSTATVAQVGAVSCIDFQEDKPFHFTVTTGTRVRALSANSTPLPPCP